MTICVQARRCLLADIVDGVVKLTAEGQLGNEVWRSIPRRFALTTIDEYVVMPNHIHALLNICEPNTNQPKTSIVASPTLGQVIRTFKAASSHAIRAISPDFTWQRSYYEHIVRTERSLDAVRGYIRDNPLKWELDEYNPARQGRAQ